jgi:hypothetical protein
MNTLNHQQAAQRREAILQDYLAFKANKHKGGMKLLMEKYGLTKQGLYAAIYRAKEGYEARGYKIKFVDFDKNKVEKKELWERLKKSGEWGKQKDYVSHTTTGLEATR